MLIQRDRPKWVAMIHALVAAVANTKNAVEQTECQTRYCKHRSYD
jgi:hypothetical protein